MMPVSDNFPVCLSDISETEAAKTVKNLKIEKGHSTRSSIFATDEEGER